MRAMIIFILFFLFAIDSLNAQSDSTISLPNSYIVFNEKEHGIYRKKRFTYDSIIIEEGYSRGIDINGRYGECKFYYDTGNLKMVGLFDQSKKPDGLFKYYYPSGEIAKKDFFTKGNKKGKCTSYFKNGKVESYGKYNFKLFKGNRIESKQGKWVYYYDNGIKREEGVYYFREIIFKEDLFSKPSRYIGNTPIYNSWKKDVKHGVWKYWDAQGNLIKIETYKKGQLIKTIIEDKGVPSQKPTD